ncbi:MAG TPA: MFS transporter [Thermoleophilaceae bacterium]|nr:MFS transporter [Thermoleophilaceae bacterium]
MTTVGTTEQNSVAEPRATRKQLVLAVCCVSQFMVILDLSIVNVALPNIQEGLRFSSADLQWVVNAYAIIFAGFLMLAGRAADLFGQRRTFALALFIFSLASLIGGIAPTSGVLIFARGLQGLGGAGMAACSLAIITSTFAAGPERHRAIALWGAMNGAGGAAGVLFGGVITDVLSWRWVLLINVPIGLAAAAVAAAVVVERRGQERRTFDLLGALVLTSGLLIVTYGGVTAGSDGWGSASALVPLVVGNVVLALFGFVESRAKAPLVPPKSLTPALKLVNGIVVLFSAAIFPMWFVSSLYLQQVLDLSPLETGLVFLPMALVIFACASQAGKLAMRVGVRLVLGGGLILMAVGMALLARAGSGGSAVQYVMLPGVLTAMGIGFSIVPSTIAATQSAGPEQAGLASGFVNTARQAGGGLGLAILISIATQLTAHRIGDGQPVEDALTHGFQIAYLLCAGLAAVAALLSFAFLPRAPAAESAAARRRVVLGATAILAVFLAVDLGVPRTHAAPIGDYTLKGAMRFVSAPDLHPPKLQLQLPAPKGHPLPGHIMVANFYDINKPKMVGQSGPLMLDGNLEPIWFRPVTKDQVAANLHAQTYDGKPVLTWWQGVVTGTGLIDSGEFVVVDDRYRPVAKLEGKDGWDLTLHSMVIQGHFAWVTANKNIRKNLSRYGGVSSGVYIDSAVQKYDLRTGRLVYNWRASDHIPISSGETQPPPNGYPWDAYHINSIALAPGGRVLVSMRNTWAGYLIDTRSGRIVWELGGRNSSFDIPSKAKFSWQHDIEMKSNSVVSLFDNHCCEITGAGEYLPAKSPSRGLELRLDPARHTATPVTEYTHGTTFHSQYMGNVEHLSNGDVFVGWGQVPYISAYTKDGKPLFDGAFPEPNMSYRAYVQRWVGRPLDRPRGAARVQGGRTTVYASWNGATEVDSWRVLAPSKVAAHKRTGFETAIRVNRSLGQVRIQALDASGHVIGTSSPFRSQPQN